MELFNRKNNKTDVPAEIQEYFQAEKRDRTGIAWVLAIATLVVTIALAAGIFFVGRWAYRKISGNDKKDNSSQTTQTKNSDDNSQLSDNNSSDSNNQKVDKQTEKKRRAEKKKEEDKQAREDESKQKNTEKSTTSLPGDETNQSSDNPESQQNGNIPETGPGDTLALFFAVTVLGYLLHQVYISQKSN